MVVLYEGEEKKNGLEIGSVLAMRREQIFYKQSRCIQDVAAKVHGPELVALGPVVITYLHRPQRQHKGLEHNVTYR